MLITKKILPIFLVFTLAVEGLWAQAPKAFQYQAVIRNDNGGILSEQAVTIRFKIHRTTLTGNIIFVETHQATTSPAGTVSLQIGKGAAEHAALDQIAWSKDSYFLEVEIDKGDGYIGAGTQQLLSVPYAQYAESAENVRIQSPSGKIWNILIDDNGTLSTQKTTE
jgi:hypothetical protein